MLCTKDLCCSLSLPDMKKEEKVPPKVSVLNVSLLSELNMLRQRLEAAELGLTHQLHVPLKENSVQECSQRLLLLQVSSHY